MQIRCKKRCHSFIGMLRDHLEKIKDGYKAILQQQTAAAPQAEATAMLGMHSTCFVCKEHIGLYSYAFSRRSCPRRCCRSWDGRRTCHGRCQLQLSAK